MSDDIKWAVGVSLGILGTVWGAVKWAIGRLYAHNEREIADMKQRIEKVESHIDGLTDRFDRRRDDVNKKIDRHYESTSGELGEIKMALLKIANRPKNQRSGDAEN